MAITLGSVVFDETRTAVRERHEEVGGRNERKIILSGVIEGESSVSAIEARLDEILNAASVEDYSAELSLRSGRRLMVRRNKFDREISKDVRAGSFKLELGAQEPFEESSAVTTVNWTIAASGATQAVAAGGTALSHAKLTLLATGAVINPSFSDGAGMLVYSGTVADGETLIIDGAPGLVTLEGSDVTPYTSGAFPRIDPAGTTLTYTDDVSSTHTAAVTIEFRDRWW